MISVDTFEEVDGPEEFESLLEGVVLHALAYDLH